MAYKQPEFPDYQEIRMTVKTARGEIFDVCQRINPDAGTSVVLWTMQRMVGMMLTELRAAEEKYAHVPRRFDTTKGEGNE